MCKSFAEIRNSISIEFEFLKFGEITDAIWNLCYLICIIKRHIVTVKIIHVRVNERSIQILGKITNIELSKIRHCCDNLWKNSKIILAYGESFEFC